jgi:hypothetical protein
MTPSMADAGGERCPGHAPAGARLRAVHLMPVGRRISLLT